MRLFALLALIPFLGCTHIRESDRQLNDQNEKAGGFVFEKATEPEVKQAGADVKANSSQLSKTLGKPETPEVYSPGASAKWRKQNEEDQATPFWKLALGGVGTFLMGLLSSGLLTRVAPTIFGGPIGTALGAVVEGIARSRLKAQDPANAGKISEADLLESVKNVVDRLKIGKLVAPFIEKAEKKLTLSI